MGFTKKGEQTRQKILETAIQLFSRSGYNGTTTKEIAERAGVAEGTLFRYFNNKKDLLQQILEPRVLQSAQQLTGQVDHLPVGQALEVILRDRLNLVEANWQLLKVIFFEAGFNEDLRIQVFPKIVFPLHQEFKTFLEKRMEKGELRKVDCYLALQVLVGMLFSLLSNKYLVKPLQPINEMDDEQYVKEMVEIFLKGVGSNA